MNKTVLSSLKASSGSADVKAYQVAKDAKGKTIKENASKGRTSKVKEKTVYFAKKSEMSKIRKEAKEKGDTLYLITTPANWDEGTRDERDYQFFYILDPESVDKGRGKSQKGGKRLNLERNRRSTEEY